MVDVAGHTKLKALHTTKYRCNTMSILQRISERIGILIHFDVRYSVKFSLVEN